MFEVVDVSFADIDNFFKTGTTNKCYMDFYKVFKGAFFLILVFLVLSCGKEDHKPEIEENKEMGTPVYEADPTIFYHDDVYYLYGTNDRNPNNGYQVYTSTDLEVWQGPKGAKNGYALVKEDVFGDNGFWAPQVWHENGRFYMAYTANESIAIASSNSPLGPFTQTEKKNIAAPVRIIDPFVFTDDDGKKYLYQVRLASGNRIFVAEMTADYTAIDPTTLKECIVATEEWENTAGASWSVAEGPTVFKRDGLYYMVYSANDFRNQNYAVGYATSHSVYGPWEKYDGNPILSMNSVNWPGVGHGDLMWDKENNPFYVFHGHFSSSEPTPRRTALAKAAFEKNGEEPDKLVIDPDSFYFIGVK